MDHHNTIKTPHFSHITPEDLDHIYEPSEDSFLLIDALEKDLDLIRAICPAVCLEVGSGSGVVITALATALGPRCCYLATDINLRACRITQETGQANDVSVNAINTDLVDGVRSPVDVLIFNPPYVVTPSEEVGRGDLEHTWAGGELGREVMDRLFPRVSELLSSKGVFYLVVLKENRPQEVAELLALQGFSCTTLLSRTTGPEKLSVLRFTRNR
ncbi:methyltransferase N6AMT1-like [Portunus trituberculatus]|uniref:Methyltransferase HEMK2 n=1 Tax=Portunus trituberculatus TaxID=210409 RepID=A0A5B7G995_PORTR|nr:methyltransferase N6AMT1-like [Portunus trituberculatus]MPC56830.1 HemK methyltransferase family member 2 [Portunus trituberculatus]